MASTNYNYLNHLLDIDLSDDTRIGFNPIRNQRYEQKVDNISIIASRLKDGYLYGRNSSTLYRSSNKGNSWEMVGVIAGTPYLLVKAGDGEVLAACGSAGLLKSSGWNRSALTATWEVKISTNGDSDFLSWGLDSDGNGLCIATHYRSADYTKSRFTWLSRDCGDNWHVIHDLGENSDLHMHFAAIDPWANNRLWISYHQLSANGSTKAVRYSDDLGGTWKTLSSEWQPTTCVATPNGMVMGTDDGPGGILHVPRMENADDMYIYLAAPLPVEQTPFAWNFAIYSQYDENTGAAYVSFVSQVDGTPAAIFASDGIAASEILRSEPQNNGDGFKEFSVFEDQIIFYAVIKDSGGTPTEYVLRTEIPSRGATCPYNYDTGRIFGGTLTGDNPFRSVSVGPYSVVGPSTDGVAIGNKSRAGTSSTGAPGATAVGAESSATHAGSTAIGYKAVAPSSSVAVGGEATCTTTDVAIGRQAVANTAAVSVGYSADARSSGVAIGYQATYKSGTTASHISIGRSANADSYGVALGREADAEDYSIAIGYQAVAGFNQSVAIGRGVTVTVANSVAIGSNDLHIQDAIKGVILTSPNSTKYRIRVDDAGVLSTEVVA